MELQFEHKPLNSTDSKSIDNSDSKSIHVLNKKELEMIERIEKIYIILEKIAINEAKFFSDSDKAGLRKARAEVQRIRLWLYDIAAMSPSKGTFN